MLLPEQLTPTHWAVPQLLGRPLWSVFSLGPVFLESLPAAELVVARRHHQQLWDPVLLVDQRAIQDLLLFRPPTRGDAVLLQGVDAVLWFAEHPLGPNDTRNVRALLDGPT